jgi:hypothetical protein
VKTTQGKLFWIFPDLHFSIQLFSQLEAEFGNHLDSKPVSFGVIWNENIAKMLKQQSLVI